MTLIYSDGSKSIYKAGHEVVNFGQLQIGDQVKVEVTEEVTLFIGSDAPPSQAPSIGVVFAPASAKTGGVFVNTQKITVKITAVDTTNSKATLRN